MLPIQFNPPDNTPRNEFEVRKAELKAQQAAAFQAGDFQEGNRIGAILLAERTEYWRRFYAGEFD